MARRKNTKRIDPRYFLHETTNRDIEEAGSFTTNMPDDVPSTADVMQKMRDDGTAPEESPSSGSPQQQARAIASDLIDSGILEKHTGKVFDEDVVAGAIANLLAGRY